ncbi:uncharacterized protein LACBIDRAFT_303935 [Laccaria bicolor S238N-H82]|uniref:Predicted protein n=1 Tax=Laccaria bicolor (strain S238N-H82 / ATCC MYA-4686) TaxID=486041 RepID=B0DK01_LACBS|nr:uncharacterized protein LACBIDRAFT_303935 [Laccaria bicolor S238N-H82]EDR05105.1 predicted protein [Laccaria bicolor S238N-H82]|eukprot:XP_001884495.1 predicted protein [Laccaria bicolor S238N-H82]
MWNLDLRFHHRCNYDISGTPILLGVIQTGSNLSFSLARAGKTRVLIQVNEVYYRSSHYRNFGDRFHHPDCDSCSTNFLYKISAKFTQPNWHSVHFGALVF